MLLQAANKIPVTSRGRRSRGLPVFAGGMLKGAVLLGLVCYQGMICARTTFCEPIPAYIVVPDDAPYECDIFDVSNVVVEAVGASFISAEVLTQTSTVDSGYISMGPGFSVAEGASFSASFVPDATYFTCAGSCHKW